MNERAVIYLLRDPSCRSPEALGRLLRFELAPRILSMDSVSRLQIDVADERADVKTPSLKDPRERALVALVKLKLSALEDRHAIERLLRDAELALEGYLVSESPYKEYGENAHSLPRDWPDGLRSPGIVAITCLPRPARIPYEEWMRRWHGRMSPVSEAIQPRTRYMRNVVVEALTEGAPELGGIVEEAYPSKEHVENRYLFFGAKGPLQLTKNMLDIFRAVSSFVNVAKLRTTMMSEYFILSEGAPQSSDGGLESGESEGKIDR